MDYMGVKIKCKCFNCGTINEIDVEPVDKGTVQIHFVCQNCGALNTLDVDPQNPDNKEQDWLCLPPTGFEWVLPAGKITPIIGDPIYISAFGEHLSRKVYLERYKVDPEIAYQYMRKKRNAQTASMITNKPSQSFVAYPILEISNIQKIEVLCSNCYRICELNI
jgi:hypothetical protein